MSPTAYKRGLGTFDPEPQPPSSELFLLTCNGNGERVLQAAEAEALFRRRAQSPGVSGDLSRGFAWQAPGAHPPTRFAVTPVTATQVVNLIVPP